MFIGIITIKQRSVCSIMRYRIKWCDHQQKVNWQFTNISRSTYLVFHLEASVVQLFLSEAHREKTLFEPLLFLLSFCHLSLCLSLCPVSRPVFYFFLLCSSRVVLGGPVLPETPGTSPLSVFSLFTFRLLSLSTLYLLLLNFLSLSIPPTSKRQKGKPS